MKTAHDIECRSLALARWANLFMGVAGIAAAIVSNASALMLDGLFSGVNFLAAIFAAGVAKSVQRRPDALRPFGYEIDESVYIMFRSLVLTGVIFVAAFNACAKIFVFATGGDVPPVKLDWVAGYLVLMVVICLGLAAWHHGHWLKTDRKSDILKTERAAAIIDGLLSAAAGVAFGVIALLQGTPLGFLTPISDAVVVLILSAYMISAPIRMFSHSMREVVGESADPSVLGRLGEGMKSALTGKPFQYLHVSAIKTGRALFAAAYVCPDQSVTVAELDAVRKSASEECQSRIPELNLRVEILFTARNPYSEDQGEKSVAG